MKTVARRPGGQEARRPGGQEARRPGGQEARRPGGQGLGPDSEKSSALAEDIFEVPGATPNFHTELAAQLAELVPEAVADGKLDVVKLKDLLGEDASPENERFGLFWPGKKRALHAAQAPTTATLAPDFARSKDWDTTQNVFIEGDNLEVLKILQRHYHNQIKLIYIDPPYNTGKDFVYPDNYQEGLSTYLEWTRQVNEEGKKVSTNSEAEGRYHSNWLNMMYPRLKLARNLLTDDGVIFISIDDSEMENLKRLASEVFGEINFVGTMIWAAGRKNDSKFISASHEYILCFVRNKEYLKEQGIIWRQRKKGLDEIYAQHEKLRRQYGDDYAAIAIALKKWFKDLSDSHPAKAHKHYSQVDKRGVYFAADISWPGGGGPKYEVLHPKTMKPVKQPARGWITPDPEKMKNWITDERVHFGIDEDSVPCLKTYLKDQEYQAPYSVFYQDGRAATKRLRELMGGDYFDFPKDETVLQEITGMIASNDDLVADFFAGSSTTAHAVMKLNAEDGGQRRFIMVQLPEPTPEDSEARKAGFKTIADISRKRIELAGEKIKQEAGLMAQELDTGFRAYTLTDTHFAKWRVTSDIEPDKLEQRLLDLRDSTSDDAQADDLLTEILLKIGFSLTATITSAEIAGLAVKRIGDNLLLAYLDEHIKPTLEQLRALVDAEPMRLIVLEDAFHGDDELKTNLAQYARSKGVELWTA